MKIPKGFEDVFRGVDLTEGEIRTLTWIAGWESRTVKNLRSAIQKAQDAALTALRPVSREQVEKVWRGEWMGSADGYADGELVYDTWECSHCGYVIDEEDDPDMLPQFCPKCYAAMTDKAVEMVMERLEALHETDLI